MRLLASAIDDRRSVLKNREATQTGKASVINLRLMRSFQKMTGLLDNNFTAVKSPL